MMKELMEKLILKVFEHLLPSHFPLFHVALSSLKSESLPIHFHNIVPRLGE